MHTSRTPGALSVHDIPKLRISHSFSTPTRKLFPTQAKKGISTTGPCNVHVRTDSAMMSRYRAHSEDQTRNLSNHPLHVASALRHLFLIASKLD